MRYAILGDIHANRAALDAVLADAAGQAVDRYACVGDIVGYNADPSYCLSTLRPLIGRDVVRGNHDHYCMGQTLLTGVNAAAAAVIHKTREMLSDEERAYLASLPFTRTITGNPVKSRVSGIFMLKIIAKMYHFQDTKRAFLLLEFC